MTPGPPFPAPKTPGPARFAVTTLGCKVNQYESAAITEALRGAGLTPTDPRSPGPVELLVVNTCCVTAPAMAKSRHALARAVRSAPEAVVLVVGCYGDYDARRLARLLVSLGVPPGKAVIAGHHGDLSTRILQALALLARPGAGRASVGSLGREQPTSGGEESGKFPSATTSELPTSTPPTIRARRQAAVKHNLPATAHLPSLRSFPGRQRAIVKVQDGCDAFCAYCIVPYIRCRTWSRPPDVVERECRELVAAGHREIVVCGVFLGAYGRDTAVRSRWGRRPCELPNLVRRLAAIEGLWRLRLSSLECGDITDELLAACTGTDTIAPHFHLPLQSGSNRILRRMNRRYTPEEFLQAVARLRAALDRPAITTDILVGFPGEEEADFAATLAAARQAGFAEIHAFPFSPIEPTAAWVLRRQAAPAHIVKQRMAQLAALEAELASEYRSQFVGQTLQALVEGRAPPSPMHRAWGPRRALSRPDGIGPRRSVALHGGGRWLARTDRYFTVTVDAAGLRPGQVILAAIEGTGQGGKPMPARLVRVPADAQAEAAWT